MSEEMDNMKNFLEMGRLGEFVEHLLLVISDNPDRAQNIAEARMFVRDGSILSANQFLHYVMTRKLVVWGEFPND